MEYPPQADPLLNETNEPVETTLNVEEIDKTAGLCLSGGGFRATLFHIGSVRRLNEAGFLKKLSRLSGVSGGSITLATLAACWNDLHFDENGVATNIETLFEKPLLNFTDKTIDIPNIFAGMVPGVSASRRLADAYDKHLFRGKTLQALPNFPIFVINATNMKTGVLWRFTKAFAADYRIGMIRKPEIRLADAVAASSAFPPILSPMKLNLSRYQIEKTEGADLHFPPYTKRAALTDGGVYDNIGLETIYKRCKTIFVSNAGGSVPDYGGAFNFWSTQLQRIITIMNGQHDSLRIRQLIEAFKEDERNGAYWGLNSRLDRDHQVGSLSISNQDVRDGEDIRVRLNRFKPDEKEQLIKLGYCLCDKALRDGGLTD